MTEAKSKHTVYIPESISSEMQAEAARQDQTPSWIIRCAWEISKDRIRALPSIQPVEQEEDPR